MPAWFSFIGVAMATMAAIIASQALISGSFTIISEAISLDLWPNIKIKYPTEIKGQMFIPQINYTLMVLCTIIVLTFGSSSNMEKFRIYLTMEDNKKAFNEIESLAREYPNDMRYLCILGDVYLNNGKPKEAYATYQKILTIEPGNPQALVSMANYYEQTGQNELYEQQIDSVLLNKKVENDIKVDIMRQMIAHSQQTGKDSTRIIPLFKKMTEGEQEDAQISMSLYSSLLNITLYALNRIDLMNIVKIVRSAMKVVLTIGFFELINKDVSFIGLVLFLTELSILFMSYLMYRRTVHNKIVVSAKHFNKPALYAVLSMVRVKLFPLNPYPVILG